MSSYLEEENNFVSLLLDYFRKNKYRYDHSSQNLVMQYLFRSYGQKISFLEKKISSLGYSQLETINPKNIRNFAQNCLKLIREYDQSNNKNNKEENINMKKIAESNIKKAIQNGLTQNEAIKLAANKLIDIKNKEEKIIKQNKILSFHPLKESLQSLCINPKKIAKEDIRNHLLNLKKDSKNSINKGEGVLYGLLIKARSFSIYHLHGLLGDELFYLCKPLGFLDKNETILEVLVASSSHQTIAHFQKADIINCLKKDESFKNVRDIKFKT